MFVERLRAFPRHGLYHQAPERIGIKTAMTHLLDELHAFWLGQDLLNREWALHPRCNTRRQTQCPVLSFGASAVLARIFHRAQGVLETHGYIRASEACQRAAG